jgi:hypothetical protein
MDSAIGKPESVCLHNTTYTWKVAKKSGIFYSKSCATVPLPQADR